jgi:hypothetical protein
VKQRSSRNLPLRAESRHVQRQQQRQPDTNQAASRSTPSVPVFSLGRPSSAATLHRPAWSTRPPARFIRKHHHKLFANHLLTNFRTSQYLYYNNSAPKTPRHQQNVQEKRRKQTPKTSKWSPKKFARKEKRKKERQREAQYIEAVKLLGYSTHSVKHTKPRHPDSRPRRPLHLLVRAQRSLSLSLSLALSRARDKQGRKGGGGVYRTVS